MERRTVFGWPALGAALVLLAAAAASAEERKLVESGTVTIKEYEAAFIGSGTLGDGVLRARGETRRFKLGGLGIGGIGIAKIDAHGTVYNLKKLEDFPGVYGDARLGAAVADKGKGRLWLENPKGVVLVLESKMEGVALTLGADGLDVKWAE